MEKLLINAIKQIDESYCWATCLSMALDYYHVKFSQDELDEKFNINKEGAQLFDLNDLWDSISLGVNRDYFASKKLVEIFPNLKKYEKEIDFDIIKKNIDSGNPIIIGINGHALLIIGYNQNNVIFCDPFFGKEFENEVKQLLPKIHEFLIIKK